MRKLAKLKISLDMNFQTFNNIILSIKQNTNYLTTSMKKLNFQKFKTYSFPSFAKNIVFIKVMIMNLGVDSLKEEIVFIFLKICESLLVLEDSELVFETLHFIFEILENSKLESPVLGKIFRRILVNPGKVDSLLKLTAKWVRKKKYSQTINRLWPEHSDVLFQIIRTGILGRLYLYLMKYINFEVSLNNLCSEGYMGIETI